MRFGYSYVVEIGDKLGSYGGTSFNLPAYFHGSGESALRSASTNEG